MRSTMQYFIWQSIVFQLQKAGETKTPYYNKAYALMKLNEPKPNEGKNH
jgi:hypothetical protein